MVRQTSQDRAPAWLAGLIAAMGVFVVLMAVDVIPIDPESLHAPRWVPAVGGLVFVLGGLLAAVGPGRPLLKDLLAGLLILGMAAIATWIAFGPGERRFSGGISVGPVGIRGGTGPSFGRIVFGVGAVLLWAMFAFATYRCAKQLRQSIRT